MLLVTFRLMGEAPKVTLKPLIFTVIGLFSYHSLVLVLFYIGEREK